MASADQADSATTPPTSPQDRDVALYRFLVESLTDAAVFAVSVDGKVISWNSGARKTFGYTLSEIIGRPFEIIFTPADRNAGAPSAELTSALAGEAEHDRWHVRKDGSRFWGTNTVHPLYDASGVLLGFTKLVRDTTASHLATEALGDSEQRLRLLIDSVRGFAIFSVDPNGTVIDWTSGAESVLGYTKDDIVGRSFSMLFDPADTAGGKPWSELRAAERRGTIDVSQWLVRKDGSRFLAGGKTSRLVAGVQGEPRGFVKLVHDSTEQHRATEKLRLQAQFDALTKLPNRRTFMEHVQRAISMYKRRATTRYAVMFIDMDHFKSVNDRFGHGIADAVLARFSRRLERCIRAGDIVARVGGDEFAILLNGIMSARDADDAAQRIIVEMREPFETEAGDVFAAVSVGIALGTSKHAKPDDVLHDADAAMFMAKSQGRSRAVTFDESLDLYRRENVDLTADLRHAIERDELRIVYQPILRLRDAAVSGAEALVRWEHPRRGLLLPEDFIHQAEASNLILAIDRWMLTNVSTQLARWQSRGITTGDFAVSVNVSSKEFSQDGFADEVKTIVGSSGIIPRTLRLEITEETSFERSQQAYDVLAAVRESGVRVDVDDFGTGYASLGALSNIVIDGLKLDWSFVNRLDARHGWEIVESVIDLAKKLGLVTTAEGIETADQLERLIKLGCDFGQGFLFAAGLTSSALEDFLRDTAGERKAGAVAEHEPPTVPVVSSEKSAGRDGKRRRKSPLKGQ